MRLTAFLHWQTFFFQLAIFFSSHQKLFRSTRWLQSFRYLHTSAWTSACSFYLLLVYNNVNCRVRITACNNMRKKKKIYHLARYFGWFLYTHTSSYIIADLPSTTKHSMFLPCEYYFTCYADVASTVHQIFFFFWQETKCNWQQWEKFTKLSKFRQSSRLLPASNLSRGQNRKRRKNRLTI